MAKQLKIFRSMAETNSVGWVRDDVHMVHVFAQAKPGERIVPSDGFGRGHWPCVVCDLHKYTEQEFWAQLKTLIEEADRDGRTSN